MIKRLICSILVLAAFMTMLAGNVSAAEYYYEDFSNATTSSTAGAKVYLSIPNYVNGSPMAQYAIENEALYFKKSSCPQADQVAAGNKVPEFRLYFDNKMASSNEIFIELDFMFGNNAKMSGGGEIISYMYVHNKRFLTTIGYTGLHNTSYATTATTPLSKNVWYSGLFHVKLKELTTNNSGTVVEGGVDVYQKLKTDSAYTYLQTIALDNRTSNNYYLQLYGDYRKDQDIYVDNVKIYDGINVKNPYFAMDGNKITSINNVTNGTLSVNAEVLYGEMATATASGVKKTIDKAITPVMTVFDKNGKMVECVIPTSFGLKPGTNNLKIDYNTAAFYNKITDGSIGFYLWKDITTVRPLTDAVELKK